MGGDDDGRLERMEAQLAALTGMLAERVGPKPAPGLTLEQLHSKWADTHGRLASFACDDMRARRILGMEPFELRDDEGFVRLEAWKPAEGPHAGVALAARDASTLTGEDVDQFRAWYYIKTTRRKGPPCTATVNRYVMMLKRILNHAVKRDTIPRSPLHGFDVEDEDNAREVVIEEDQFAALLSAFGEDARMVALTTLGYDSGMRRTELLCCRWSWFDADAGQVHIPGAVAKNGEKRTTDLSVRAWAALRELPRHLRNDLVFPNPDSGQPYNGRWIHELFVRGVERAGIVGRDGTAPRLHDLRRSFVTLMGRRGIPESVIMAKSGHRDHKVFKRYRIVNEVELRDAWVLMETGRQGDLAKLEAKCKAPHAAPDSHSTVKSKGKSSHI